MTEDDQRIQYKRDNREGRKCMIVKYIEEDSKGGWVQESGAHCVVVASGRQCWMVLDIGGE